MELRGKQVRLRDTIPTCRSTILTETGDDGFLVLSYPRFPYKWMNIFLPKYISPYIHVPLEEYGSWVWSQINGQRTVEEIACNAATLHPKEEDMKNRTIMFIHQLYLDKFITLKIDK